MKDHFSFKTIISWNLRVGSQEGGGATVLVYKVQDQYGTKLDGNNLRIRK